MSLRLGPSRSVAGGLCVLGSLLLAGPLAAQSDKEQREAPEVRSVTLQGVHHIDEGLLRQSLATQPSKCRSILLEPFCLVSHSGLFVAKHYLDETEFKRDALRIRVFYFKRGYRQTQVDTTVEKKGDQAVAVTFRISEGPPTLVTRITVDRPDTILSGKEVRRALQLRAGQPLDLIALDSSVVLLRNRYWDKGYADAMLRDTSIVDDTLHTAQVRIAVDPKWLAHIGSITVTGNEGISRGTIDNMITMHDSAIYRRSDLIESQRNLYASNLFRRAVILVPPEGDSLKAIRITLQEAPFHDAQVSGGFNTVDFVQVQGTWTNYNWLGGAKRLRLSVVLGNLFASALDGVSIFQDVRRGLTDAEASPYFRPTYQVSADFTQPWLYDPRNSAGASLFSHRRSTPGIFIDQGYGGNLSFTRQLQSRAPLSLIYQYEQTKVNASPVYFCVNYGVCESTSITALQRRSALSPLSLSLVDDRSNDPLNPTRGYTGRVDLEHASRYTLSDYRYNRIFANATGYLPFGKSVIAGHVRAGWVGALASTREAFPGLPDTATVLIHPRKRFYAGGSQSVRGYGENQLGPRILTIDTLTLRNAGCTISAGGAACPPDSLASIPSSAFQPRPTGGTSLVEASVEYRFPIWSDKLQGAVFVDGAFVGEHGGLLQIARGTGAITPGFGVRYMSPVGPIRVDLGIRPTLKERLPVVTEFVTADGRHLLVPLSQDKIFDPVGSGSGFRQVLNRLALHLAIGQAF